MEIFHLTAQNLQRGYQKPKDRQPNHYSNYLSGVNLQFSQGINKLLGRSISLLLLLLRHPPDYGF